MNAQQILAPIRDHARRSPDERLDIDGAELVRSLVATLDRAQPALQRHVATTLEILAPRLYDLWDAAGAIDPRPAWLAPLAVYARPAARS